MPGTSITYTINQESLIPMIKNSTPLVVISIGAVWNMGTDKGKKWIEKQNEKFIYAENDKIIE